MRPAVVSCSTNSSSIIKQLLLLFLVVVVRVAKNHDFFLNKKIGFVLFKLTFFKTTFKYFLTHN